MAGPARGVYGQGCELWMERMPSAALSCRGRPDRGLRAACRCCKRKSACQDWKLANEDLQADAKKRGVRGGRAALFLLPAWRLPHV